MNFFENPSGISSESKSSFCFAYFDSLRLTHSTMFGHVGTDLSGFNQYHASEPLLSGLMHVRVQNVCKGYQQTRRTMASIVGKEII